MTDVFPRNSGMYGINFINASIDVQCIDERSKFTSLLATAAVRGIAREVQVRIYARLIWQSGAPVAELVDAADSKSVTERCGGSSPSSGTKLRLYETRRFSRVDG